MLARVLAEIRDKAAEWESDAQRRREITPIDPVADTRAYDARELRELATKLDKDTEELTTQDYARLHKTTPQTITRWIREQKIKARHTANGWMILRDTPAPRRGKPRSAT